MRYVVFALLSIFLVACTSVQDPLSCRMDSDCVIETYYEGHCCSSDCTAHPVSKSTQQARLEWRNGNCDAQDLTNGSLATPDKYEKWTFCLAPFACNATSTQAYCDAGTCKAR